MCPTPPLDPYPRPSASQTGEVTLPLAAELASQLALHAARDHAAHRGALYGLEDHLPRAMAL